MNNEDDTSSSPVSDSGSDDFSVLDIISDGKASSNRVLEARPRVPNRQQVPEASTKTASAQSDVQEDEFEIALPAIFLTDGKKNEELAKKDAKIRADLMEDEIRVKQEHEQLQLRKEAIAQELNDNGVSGNLYSLEDERDNAFVEKLLRHNLDGPNGFTHRHFYFYGNNIPTDHRLDIQLPIEINEDLLYLELQADNYMALYLNVCSFFPQFIHHILVSVQDVNCLNLASKFVEFLYKSDVDSSDTVTQEEFINLIRFLGGDTKYIVPHSTVKLPLKLVHYYNYGLLAISRLSLVFHYVLFTTKKRPYDEALYKVMLKTFMFTISDFNLNENCVPDLIMNFITPVFTNLVKWRQLNLKIPNVSEYETIYVVHDVMLAEINQILSDNILTYPYYVDNETNASKYDFKKIDYGLTYNIYRLLNLAIVQTRSDSYSVRLVTSLCLSFINEAEYTLLESFRNNGALDELNFQSYSYTPAFKFLIGVLNKINSLNCLECLVSNDVADTNAIYMNYYKLLLLNMVIFDTFHSNANTVENRAKFESIRSSNYSSLTQLNSALIKLKNNFHKQLGQLSNISSTLSTSLHKDAVIDYVTESYHLLHYLTTKFDKDIMLVQEDIFYEDNSFK